MFRSLPNLLTAARLLLAPVIAWAILERKFTLALWLLGAAALTDAFDGLLARRLDASSRLGAYLDPLADKALLMTVYFSAGMAGLLPAWLVALVFGRDALILGMAAWGFLFTSIREFPPSVWGKLCTLAQIGGALYALSGADAPTGRAWMLAAVASTTAWSGLHYAGRGIVLLARDAKRQ